MPQKGPFDQGMQEKEKNVNVMVALAIIFPCCTVIYHQQAEYLQLWTETGSSFGKSSEHQMAK